MKRFLTDHKYDINTYPIISRKNRMDDFDVAESGQYIGLTYIPLLQHYLLLSSKDKPLHYIPLNDIKLEREWKNYRNKIIYYDTKLYFQCRFHKWLYYWKDIKDAILCFFHKYIE